MSSLQSGSYFPAAPGARTLVCRQLLSLIADCRTSRRETIGSLLSRLGIFSMPLNFTKRGIKNQLLNTQSATGFAFYLEQLLASIQRFSDPKAILDKQTVLFCSYLVPFVCVLQCTLLLIFYCGVLKRGRIATKLSSI